MSRELFSLSAEQAVLGAVMIDNNAIDRISSLEASHFYRADHRMIYEEMLKQIIVGKRVDAVVGADLKLTHRADRNLTQGGALRF